MAWLCSLKAFAIKGDVALAEYFCEFAGAKVDAGGPRVFLPWHLP